MCNPLDAIRVEEGADGSQLQQVSVTIWPTIISVPLGQVPAPQYQWFAINPDVHRLV